MPCHRLRSSLHGLNVACSPEPCLHIIWSSYGFPIVVDGVKWASSDNDVRLFVCRRHLRRTQPIIRCWDNCPLRGWGGGVKWRTASKEMGRWPSDYQSCLIFAVPNAQLSPSTYTVPIIIAVNIYTDWLIWSCTYFRLILSREQCVCVNQGLILRWVSHWPRAMTVTLKYCPEFTVWPTRHWRTRMQSAPNQLQATFRPCTEEDLSRWHGTEGRLLRPENRAFSTPAH